MTGNLRATGERFRVTTRKRTLVDSDKPRHGLTSSDILRQTLANTVDFRRENARLISDRRITVAHVGCGAWGRNLVRELASHREVHLKYVIDPCPEARGHARTLAPWIVTFPTIDALLLHPVDAVTIASPGPFHAKHAWVALQSGADVFVEKPMTMSTVDAKQLANMCKSAGKIGMAGHLMRYHPAVERMLTMIREGQIGEPISFDSARLCLANAKDTDGSLLWSLAPHDISVLHGIDPQGVRQCTVQYRTIDGAHAKMSVNTPENKSANALRPNVAVLRLVTHSGLQARIALSRAHGKKVRRIRVCGTEGSLLFDDTPEGWELVLRVAGRQVPVEVPASSTPLAAELGAFVTSVRTRCEPLTGFFDGLEVVRVLERLQPIGASLHPSLSELSQLPALSELAGSEMAGSQMAEPVCRRSAGPPLLPKTVHM